MMLIVSMLRVFMLKVIVLSIVMPNDVILSVHMPSVIMLILNVCTLSVIMNAFTQTISSVVILCVVYAE
jgi:hypothetical protein